MGYLFVNVTAVQLNHHRGIMAFFWRKAQQPQETKSAPDLGRAMFVPGTVQADWMTPSAENFAKEGYSQNAVVYACVQKIASALASVDLDIAKYTGKDRTTIDNHPLRDLLERPNPSQGGAEFFKALASFFLIAGNGYVLKLPLGARPGTKPTEMWVMRPDRMSARQNDKGQTTAYVYKTSTNEVTFPIDLSTGACDILHIKDFNPLNDHLGMATMQPAANSVDIVNSALKWNYSLLKNSARPSGAFVVSMPSGSTGTSATAGTLSEEQFQRLREQVQQDSGTDAAGRPLILEGGLDWKEMSLSPKDMEFEGNMWAAARLIATAFGVPPQLVNIPGDSTYNNMLEAKLSLWQETVLPLLDLFLDAFNNWLTPIYDAKKTIFICYDLNSIPAIEEARYAKLERLSSVSYLTIDEKRQLAGFGNYPGGNGDVIFADANAVPLDILGEAPDDSQV